MGVVRGFVGWPRGPLHLAIGVFDGFHLGHRAVLARLVSGAAAAGAAPVGATFDPLPIEVLAPGAPPSALSDAAERAELLAGAGARTVILFPYDAAFSRLEAAEFLRLVREAGDVRRIVVGEDFRFGHRRGGDVAMLRGFGGWEVDVVPPVRADGDVVSSTRIRNLLLAGDVSAAAALLGRSYAVRGRVVPGAEHGRSLGYPTIEVAAPRERILPRDGIYATWVAIGGRRHAAATSLGLRPSAGTGERPLESFLIDRSGDVRAEEATTTFVRRLRDELRFASPEDLVRQIAVDVEQARAALLG